MLTRRARLGAPVPRGSQRIYYVDPNALVLTVVAHDSSSSPSLFFTRAAVGSSIHRRSASCTLRRYDDAAAAGMHGLPWQAGSRRTRRLLPATGREAGGLPVQPTAQFSGWTAPLRPDGQTAGTSFGRLPACYCGVLFELGSCLFAAIGQHRFVRSAGARPCVGDSGRCDAQAPCLRSVPQ